MHALGKTNFQDLTFIRSGKVRDIYEVGVEDSLLIITTDRMSAYDVVMEEPFPGKGHVLHAISCFWFEFFKHIPNHIITTDPYDFPLVCRPYLDDLKYRSMLVKKAKPLSVECIVRGYISGSGWKDYQKDGMICGIELPKGLVESQRLSEPIFTPSTKAEQGLHDENISFEEAEKILGKKLAKEVRDLSLTMYTAGAKYANGRGIIIADTRLDQWRINSH